MVIVDKKVVVDHSTCSTCTQCIAICPEMALSWDGIAPARFIPDLLPSPEQLSELIAERRTCRDFEATPLDRSTLAEIAAVGVLAPTHNFRLRSIIVDEPKLIAAFDRASFELSAKTYRLLFRPRLVRWLALRAARPIREEFTRATPKLKAAMRRGTGFKAQPAAIICVVGDRRVPLSVESAQYALYNMMLFAQAKGLGCQNLVGNQIAFNRSRTIRVSLGLGKHERICAVIGMGIPSVQFRNRVQGKRMRIQWNGRSENVQ